MAKIAHVSDTAFWIAHHRAEESARPDALFHDPLAATLAGERGPLIAAKMKAPHYTAWAVAVRTHVIDNLIRRCVASNQIDVVLNLGAGLDTRPYRLLLPSHVRWIEADHADVLKYKREVLRHHAPCNPVDSVTLNLADDAARNELLRRLSAESHHVLAMTEGVTPFLTNEQVTHLARDLEHHRIDFWIVDYFSGLVRRYMQLLRWSEASFPFNPRSWARFFDECGWTLREMQHLGEVGRRLNRPMPTPALAKVARVFLPTSRRDFLDRSVGYALMARKSAG